MMSLMRYVCEQLGKQAEKIYKKGLSLLDKMVDSNVNNTDTQLEELEDIINNNGPTIYAFTVDKVKNAIKVGYTDQHPLKRIDQWKEIYEKKHGFKVEPLGFWSADEFTKAGKRVFFWDFAVHEKITKEHNYKRVTPEIFYKNFEEMTKDKLETIYYSKEFFDEYRRLLNGELDFNEKEKLSKQLLTDIIEQMKLNIREGKQGFKIYSYETKEEADKEWSAPKNFNNTGLQNKAVEKGVAAMNNDKKTNLLMAAVMRFGKTHTTYDIIKQTGVKKVIVTSAKADTRSAWRDDINHVDFYKDFVFIEIKGGNYKWDITEYDEKTDKLVTRKNKNINEKIFTDKPNNPYKDKTIIMYFTLQDLGGSVGKLKGKHKILTTTVFDLLVIDETHYGSHGEKFSQATNVGRKRIMEEETDDTWNKEESEKEEQVINDLSKGIPHKKILQVSGTPYYLLASNEMQDANSEIICQVSYTDMMEARDEWNKENAKLPKNKRKKPWDSPYYGIPTLHKIGLNLSKSAREKLDDIGMTGKISPLFEISKKTGKFKYESQIIGLMKSLFGSGKSDQLAFLKNKVVEGKKACKHTIMVLPRKAACDQMKELLSNIIDTDARKIINIAGFKPDINEIDELNDELEKLDNAGKKSIMLTCIKFLTGVSIPIADSMIYLKDTSSPQEYDQNIFRLCTRYVKKVKDADGDVPKQVNMKDNVYLIDFNIGNMYKMMSNSAKMKSIADGNARIDNVIAEMKRDLASIPVFCEDETAEELLGKMKKLTPSDLMKVYSGYNENKSISDMVDEDIDLLEIMFGQKSFQDAILGLKIKGTKTGVKDPDADRGGNEQDINNLPELSKEKDEPEEFVEYAKRKLSPEEAAIAKKTKDKFRTMAKLLLYWNICQDNPYADVETIIEAVKKSNDLQRTFKTFGFTIDDVEKVYNKMPPKCKIAFSSMVTNISILTQDNSKNDIDKFLTSISNLSRIDDDEVITPDIVVNRMIEKLNDNEYKSADTILLVNEKYGEFFKGLYNKYGKDIVKKCRIVPSSEIGQMLTRKFLNSLKLNKYINTIILDIPDKNNNEYYDWDDFMQMSKNEIIDMNKGKKFSICLMNPPYSKRHNNNPIHFQFVEKVLDIAEKQITIMPSRILHTTSDNYNPWKEKFDKSLISAEELKSDVFEGTGMMNVAIYEFSKNKDSKNIRIKTLSSDKWEEKSSLFDSKIHNTYEDGILKLLNNNGNIKLFNLKTGIPKKFKERAIEDKTKLANKTLPKYKDKYLLSVNIANGGMNGHYMSSGAGKIFYNDIEKVLNDWINRNVGAIKYMVFDTKKAAENCRDAMKRSLLRFALYRTQDDQAMNNKCYKYIADIDWEDDKVKTDKGILELCGCPSDKIDEYVKYCEHIISEVDKGNYI